MATHAHRFGTLDLPRPSRAALPLVALALLALALEADPQLQLAGAAAAACFALAAVVRAERARAELRAVRRTADRLILVDAHGAEGSDIVRWRMLKLVAPDSRLELARELERTLRGSDPGRLPSASPLRRGLAGPPPELLRRLEGGCSPAVRDARGVLLLASCCEPGARSTTTRVATEPCDRPFSRSPAV